MNATNRRVGSVNVFIILALIGVAHADSNKDYFQKEFYGHIVRLPTLPGLAYSCEDTVFGGRMIQTIPKTHVLVTCGSDLGKWNELKAGKTPSDLYPMLVLSVQRHQPGAAYTASEFGRILTAVHSQVGDMIESGKTVSRTAGTDDLRPFAAGREMSVVGFVYRAVRFFDAPSALPSLSYVTSKTYTIAEGGSTHEFLEIGANSTIFYQGESLQLVVLDRAGPNGDSFKPEEITKRWLSAFSALNNAESK